MKASLALLIMTFPAVALSQTPAKTSTNFVTTDLKKDCITISSSTGAAEIDFSDEECKSFGGYQLNVSGGDLRYAPKLSYQGTAIELNNPGAFHDMGSDKIEWVYLRKVDAEGAGDIYWKGLIYRLSVSKADGSASTPVIFAVRLDGKKSCTLGTAKTNEAARELIAKSKPGCKK